MKPFFKWMGGKTKEMKRIKALLPEDFKRVVEPFAGGGAVTFELEKQAWLNDINEDIINIYSVVQDEIKYHDLMNRMKKYGIIGCDLEKEYYRCRNILNERSWMDKVEWAEAFLILRSLVFSGMHRVNKKGEFNAPFGHYQELTIKLCDDYHDYMKNKVQISLSDFESIIDQCQESDFIFVDPPYYNRASYNTDFSYENHVRLAAALKRTKAKWMVVHTDDPLYMELYSGYKYIVQEFHYSMNFKGRSNAKSKVKHAYIMNY
jgi:DNA adenine methylase